MKEKCSHVVFNANLLSGLTKFDNTVTFKTNSVCCLSITGRITVLNKHIVKKQCIGSTKRRHFI
jgi:hypothetical protein